MNKFYYIFLIFIALADFGCENVEVINAGLVYKEYTVVRAEFKANNVFEGVSITKTLPTNVPYDIKNAELTNVTAYLKINGIQVIPLNYSGDGVYNSIYRIVIHSGNTYELFADYNGKSIYAKTTVPEKPVITNANYSDNNYVNAYVKNVPGVSFGSIWEISPSPIYGISDHALDFLSVIPSGSDTLSSVLIRTMDIPLQYGNAYNNNELYVKVYAFDSAYADYFKTKNNNQPVSNIFAQGGDNIAWNVEGTDVIGLFIGSCESDDYKVSPY